MSTSCWQHLLGADNESLRKTRTNPSSLPIAVDNIYFIVEILPLRNNKDNTFQFVTIFWQHVFDVETNPYKKTRTRPSRITPKTWTSCLNREQDMIGGARFWHVSCLRDTVQKECFFKLKDPGATETNRDALERMMLTFHKAIRFLDLHTHIHTTMKAHPLIGRHSFLRKTKFVRIKEYMLQQNVLEIAPKFLRIHKSASAKPEEHFLGRETGCNYVYTPPP